MDINVPPSFSSTLILITVEPFRGRALLVLVLVARTFSCSCAPVRTSSCLVKSIMARSMSASESVSAVVFLASARGFLSSLTNGFFLLAFLGFCQQSAHVCSWLGCLRHCAFPSFDLCLRFLFFLCAFASPGAWVLLLLSVSSINERLCR